MSALTALFWTAAGVVGLVWATVLYNVGRIVEEYFATGEQNRDLEHTWHH